MGGDDPEKARGGILLLSTVGCRLFLLSLVFLLCCVVFLSWSLSSVVVGILAWRLVVGVIFDFRRGHRCGGVW